VKWIPERATVGAYVAIPVQYSHGEYHLFPIERLTPTQAVIEHNRRIRLADGSIVGADRWAPSIAFTPTDEELAELKRKRLYRDRREQLRQVNWQTVDDATIDRVWAALKGDAA
jgi:hypothetical protein